ncbi:maleylpyruvate isomerase family mycothiol-dependent enzyme [Luteococcus peritonei]|uniref:Maleylpyruvate isomerase family mycothiol-dependent enzyme n=1 Tax=Luteococcus peritonei TaxID=88874 RepID=A0ABW4RQV0_9ACTN
MSSSSHDSAALPISATMAQLRRRKREATQNLLGSTIAISDEDWQQDSRLPGWTRAHVATHLARNADALTRVVHGFLTHNPAQLYPDQAERERELEQGSLRGALELQIDLDTSAGMLNSVFGYLEESGADDEVLLAPGLRMPVNWLPVARLNEVVLHHIDLDCGFTATDVAADIARWLLEWHCLRLSGREDFPTLRIASTSGLRTRVGAGEEGPEVHGSDAALLGWLTGRGDAEALVGAPEIENLELP